MGADSHKNPHAQSRLDFLEYLCTGKHSGFCRPVYAKPHQFTGGSGVCGLYSILYGISRVFVIVAFGGLGSIRGTLYAAVILAIFEAFISWSLGAAVLVYGLFRGPGIPTIRANGNLGVIQSYL